MTETSTGRFETPDEILVALGKSPESLIGQRETEWLDFKRDPYPLGSDKSGAARFELAKDISAMANASGGLILIGVDTHILPDMQEELASSLNPIPTGQVIVKQIQDTAREWVLPQPRITVIPHDVKGSANKLWTIRIDRADSRDKPFIVARETVVVNDFETAFT